MGCRRRQIACFLLAASYGSVLPGHQVMQKKYIITLVEVSIAYAENWKNRDFYPSYHDWLGALKTERERERQRQREVLSTTKVSKFNGMSMAKERAKQ